MIEVFLRPGPVKKAGKDSGLADPERGFCVVVRVNIRDERTKDVEYGPYPVAKAADRLWMLQQVMEMAAKDENRECAYTIEGYEGESEENNATGVEALKSARNGVLMRHD